MLTGFRNRFGKIVVFSIIVLITFVFVFFGVFSPKATRGLHEGAVAGTVNGEPISIQEFNRELARRVEFFKNLSGGKLTEEQLQAFQIRESVFQEMARRKLLVQLGPENGLSPGPAEMKERIRQVPAFQKNGQFDFATYKDVLSANGYSVSGFERAIREDAILAEWESFFKVRAQVTEAEVRAEFDTQNRKRKLTSVYFAFPVGGDLKQSQAQEKQIEDLARRAQTLLKAGKAQSAELTKLAKDAKTAVQTSDWMTQAQPQVAGFGTHPQLTQDLFGAAAFGDVRLYRGVQGILVARVAESQEPSSAKYAEAREKAAEQLATRKSRALFEAYVKQASSKAKIEPNTAVVASERSG